MGGLPCGAGGICCGHGLAALPAALLPRRRQRPLYLRPWYAPGLRAARHGLLHRVAAHRPGVCTGRAHRHCRAAGGVPSGRRRRVRLRPAHCPARCPAPGAVAGQSGGQPCHGGLDAPRRLLVPGHCRRHDLSQHNVYYASALCTAGDAGLLPCLADDAR